MNLLVVMRECAERGLPGEVASDDLNRPQSGWKDSQ